MLERLRGKSPVYVVMANVAALAAFFHFIPDMRRPFEFLMLTGAGLGILSAVAVRQGLWRNLFVTVVSLSLTVFALEMLQKKFDIVNLVGKPAPRQTEPEPADGATATGETKARYVWNSHNPITYVAAKKRAVADGLDPKALAEDFAGDVFAGRDKSALAVSRDEGSRETTVVEAVKNPYRDGPPLGFELTPDNVIRHYRFENTTKTMLFDGVATINRHGFRETRGDPEGGAVLFLGCSITFGYGLSDPQTMPQRFSEAAGFAKRTLNFGVNNYGPHHALREMERSYHADRAGLDPTRVEAVVYTLIDDHARRAVVPLSVDGPRYRLVDGRLEDAGTYGDSYVLGRLAMMMDKSRIYPQIRSRLAAGRYGYAASYQWELTHAILSEIDRLARERHGVGLTILYWDKDPEVVRRLEGNGLRVVRIAEALGERWEDRPILYLLSDGHPSAHANELAGRHLWKTLFGDAGGER